MNRLNRPLAELLDQPLGDWRPLIDAWRGSRPGRALIAEVDARVAAGATIFPAQVLRALALTPLARSRVVILGQDPYHGAGQAEGLAFSVPAGVKPPPSLRNVFTELQRDLGCARPASGSLVTWAERGVLLLNTALTVEEGRPGSHAKLGWSFLTDTLIAALSADDVPKVFLLWGSHAQVHAAAIGAPHLVLSCNHPSPLSATRPPRPFIGCGHFGRATVFLAEQGRGALDWSLP